MARGAAGLGVVFAWWGGESLKTKKALKNVFAKHAAVRIEHIESSNPAAMRDAFCDDPNVFGSINSALGRLSLPAIDWLPVAGWQSELNAEPPAKKSKKAAKKSTQVESGGSSSSSLVRCQEMGDFISETQQLHRMYLERLRDGLNGTPVDLTDITGIAAQPLCALPDACEPIPLLEKSACVASQTRASSLLRGALTVDQAAAVHLYTTGHLYRQLNAALRDKDRQSIRHYLCYLRLFLSALDALPVAQAPLYRGVGLDLSADYCKKKEREMGGAKIGFLFEFSGYFCENPFLRVILTFELFD